MTPSRLRPRSRSTSYGNAVRRGILHLHRYGSFIFQLPCCISRRLYPPGTVIDKLQILVLGSPGSGKTTFCLKLCGYNGPLPIDIVVETKGKFNDPLLPFIQHYKRCCSKTTVVKYVEIGGQKPLRQQRNSMYLKCHGVICLIDLSNEEIMNQSKEFLQHLLSQPYLKEKPILVVGTKLDLCQIPMNRSIFIENFNLTDLAVEAKSLMIVMVTILETKSKEISKNVTWFVEEILKNQDDLNERITSDSEKFESLFTNNEEPLTLFSKLKQRDYCNSQKIQKEAQFPLEETIVFEFGKSETKSDEKKIDFTDTVPPFSFPCFMKHFSTNTNEVSWIEELDNVESSASGSSWENVEPCCSGSGSEEAVGGHGDAPLAGKSKSMNDILLDITDEFQLPLPLRKINGEENLEKIFIEGTFSDPVTPYTKFDENLLGPDLFSPPAVHIGGDEESNPICCSSRSLPSKIIIA